jgi:hypothetical protein
LLPLPVPNGDCRTVSFPILYNNLIWQNRSFHLELGASSGQYLQSIVTLHPSLNQPSTGSSAANGNGTIVTGGTGACVNGASYWDIGLRGDSGPTDHGSGHTLQPVSSVLTSLAGGYSSNHNSASNPTVVQQYCNGSRMPPEFASGGYQVPPGTNEGSVPVPVFSLLPGATVDEGNNWVNIKWGPLATTNPVTHSLLGNYALAAGSPAIDYITLLNSTASYNAAPTTDFFGNPRKVGNAPVDAGAIEGAGNSGGGGGGTATVSPTSVAFGQVAVNNNSLTQTLTVTNNTGAGLTALAVTPATTSTPTTPNVFTRPAGTAGGTCGATLAIGASCTINIVFRPVAASAYTGTVTITSSASIVGSPVALTGTGFTPTRPGLTVLDSFTRGNSLNLGGNWTQATLLGAASITLNTNQASDPLIAGDAFWNGTAGSGPVYGAKQYAGLTLANTTVNNEAVILAATGTLNALSQYPNFIRVRYNGGTVTVETTTNAGGAFTTAGTITGTFANGNVLTAVLDGTNAVAAPTVYVFNGATFVGSVQITPSANWSGGGRIGIAMPAGGRVDDFTGGTTP